MARILGVLLVLSVLAPGTAAGQDPNYTLRLTEDLGGPSGGSIDVEVILDIQPGATELQGWSYSVCTNFDQITPTALTTDGTTTAVAKNGSAADFNENNFFVGNAGGEQGGFNQGVVICFTGCAVLTSGFGYVIQVASLDLIAPNGTMAPLPFCDDVGMPPQPVVTLVVANGQAIVPTQISEIVDIDIIPFILTIASPGASQGSNVDVPITLTNSEDVYGFSFGVSHDPAALGVSDVLQGSALTGFPGPAGGAEFFQTQLAPSGGSGFTVGCVFSISDPTATLAPGVDLEIVRAQYDVLGGAPIGLTPLDFTDTLSPPAPAPPVAVAISIGQSSVAPTIVSGGVDVQPGGGQFSRGDANVSPGVDIADALFVLNYLFVAGPDPTCFSAADSNDDGGVDIGDPLYLLAYLFTSGPEPGPPWMVCGSDPTPDTLTCDSTPACP